MSIDLVYKDMITFAIWVRIFTEFDRYKYLYLTI